MAKRIELKAAIVPLLLLIVGPWQAYAEKKVLDQYHALVIEPFESAEKAVGNLPDAVRSAAIHAIKEEGLFTSTLTSEEAKAKENEAWTEKKGVLTLYGRLVDFDPGNAAKRMMVGLGTGRAHANFEFVLKNAASGEVVWQKTIKQTASFWFNGTTSSAAERAELPEELAKKLVKELSKLQNK
jgi:hypothetical protein